MAQIKVHDKIFEPYLSEDVIQQKIKELAAAIDKDYADKRPLSPYSMALSYLQQICLSSLPLMQKFVLLNLLLIKAPVPQAM
jgi:hypothetical protein